MSSKVYVTGGSGLVGHAISQIRNEFPEYNIHLLSSKDCNLLNVAETLKYFENAKPDVVIHLAANVGGLFKNMNFKVDMFESNMLMNMNLLKACHNSGCNRVIGTLSTCIFPDKTTYPINEDMLQHGPPHESNDAYAYAKRMLKVHADAYNEQYNTNYSCIIPTNIYGQNDNYSLENAHVIPALIHKCYLAKRDGKPFIVAGTGKPLRQFIHAQDLSRIILKLASSLNKESVIISGNEEVSIGAIARYIANAFDYDRMIFDTTLADGQFKKTADNTKMKKLIGEYDFISIEQGIKNTVDYFIRNYSTIRK